MENNPRGRRRESDHSLMSSLFLFGFGVMLLLFLVAIEHQNWFHIRPGSGTAAAMSYASTDAKPKS